MQSSTKQPYFSILRRERELRGWSQARLAETLGTTADNVRRWERGYTTPSPYFREKLCALFEKNAQELGLLPSMHEEDLVDEPLLSTESGPASENDPAQYPFSEDYRSPLGREQQKIGLDLPNKQERILAFVSYSAWWFSGLMVLAFVQRSRFVRYHALQSTIFFGLISLLLTVFISLTDIPQYDTLGGCLLGIIFTFALIGWIIALIQSILGRAYQLPLVGSWSNALLKQKSHRD